MTYPLPGLASDPTRATHYRFDSWVRGHPWFGDLLLTGTLLLLAAPFTAVEISDSHRHGVKVTFAALAIAVLHLLVPIRRTLPVVMCIASVVLGIIHAVLVPMMVPSDFIVFASIYTLTAYGRRYWAWSALGISLGYGLTAAILTTRDTPPSDDDGANLVLGLIALVMVATTAWVLGAFRHIRVRHIEYLEARTRTLEMDREERTRRAAAEERARIAREMHDVVAHSLSVVVVQAQGGAYAAKSDPANAVTVFDTIAATGRAALADMRGLLGVLRSPSTVDTGAAGSEPQPGLHDLPELIDNTRAAGLDVVFTQRGLQRALAPTASLALYRVVQESLSNTLKHAGPSATAIVELWWGPETLVVTTSDNGRGMGAAPSSGGGGHGLVGMHERLGAFGGSIRIDSPPGGGFRIVASLPYAQAAVDQTVRGGWQI